MAIVNFAWIRACVEAGLPDELPSSAKMEAKESYGNCMLNALLEDMFILQVGVVSAYTRSSWPAALTLCIHV